MKKGAFTLIELSIVLMVISLLAVGVISGQALLRNSRVNKLAKEIETFHIALKTFYATYQALPGDMSEATEFWNVSVVQNGNDNKRIDWQNNKNIYEHANAMIHLSKAGLIMDESFSNDLSNATKKLYSFEGGYT